MTAVISSENKEEKNKLILLGGSFDPIHVGHLKLIAQACSQAGAARVLVMPTAVSPFKTDTQRRLGPYRLQLCRSALEDLCDLQVDLPGFTTEERLRARAFYVAGNLQISDSELLRSGTSYTVDTLKILEEAYPELRPVILGGSDIIESLHLWHDYQTILTKADFLIAERPGYESAALFAVADKYCSAYDTKIDFLKVEMPDISSTALRERLSSYPFPHAYDFSREVSENGDGKTQEFPVLSGIANFYEAVIAASTPSDGGDSHSRQALQAGVSRFAHSDGNVAAVLKESQQQLLADLVYAFRNALSPRTLSFILQNYLYRQHDLQHLLSVEEFKFILELVNFCYQNLPLKRCIHCLNVMYMATAIKIALDRKPDLSTRSEDIPKLSLFQTAVAALFHDAAKYASLATYPELQEELRVAELDSDELLHGPVAAYLLRKKFAIEDKQILEAVYYHTTLRPQASLLDEIVYVADKIEPGRTYRDAPALRLQLRKSFTSTLKAILHKCMDFIESKGENAHPLSKAAYLEYRDK